MRSLASTSIKVVTININSSNTQLHLLKEYLQDYDPDIVFLIEITPHIGRQLSDLKTQFPYGTAVMEDGNFGIGIIGKFPLENVSIHRQSLSQIPFMSAQIKFNDKILELIAIHPYPPLGKQGTLLRNDYTEQVSQLIQTQKMPTILCGDFNASPWSYQVKKMIFEAELTIPRGNGIITTWPTSIPLLNIPIDFCLTSKSMHIQNYTRGPYVGSDHYPFQMEVDFTKN